mgnify:CR=1 FL=1
MTYQRIRAQRAFGRMQPTGARSTTARCCHRVIASMIRRMFLRLWHITEPVKKRETVVVTDQSLFNDPPRVFAHHFEKSSMVVHGSASNKCEHPPRRSRFTMIRWETGTLRYALLRSADAYIYLKFVVSKVNLLNFSDERVFIQRESMFWSSLTIVEDFKKTLSFSYQFRQLNQTGNELGDHHVNSLLSNT